MILRDKEEIKRKVYEDYCNSDTELSSWYFNFDVCAKVNDLESTWK